MLKIFYTQLIKNDENTVRHFLKYFLTKYYLQLIEKYLTRIKHISKHISA